MGWGDPAFAQLACWGLAGRVRGVLRVWCAWCVCPAGGVGVAVSADGRCVCGVSVVRAHA